MLLARLTQLQTEYLRSFLRLVVYCFQWCLSFNSSWCRSCDKLLLPENAQIYWLTMERMHGGIWCADDTNNIKIVVMGYAW